MQTLWAPWRMEYIQGDRESGCPFCELPKQEPTETNLVLFRDSDVVVMMNKFPYNPGHLLVLPRAHVGDPTELSSAVWKKLNVALQECLKISKEVSGPQGFNLGMNLGAVGGAGIPQHLHWHILPRWAGDTNFMPLLAETKALPTHNATIYRQLKGAFETFSSRLENL
jgi:ATP adenylyltransferase